MTYQSETDLAGLAAFVSVVEANGFTAAAKRTGQRKATLSLKVQALEKRVGVTLLARTTRSVRLTDEGRAYLEPARRALAAAAEAEAVVARSRVEPAGRLVVTTSVALAELLFEPVVVPFLAKHRKVTLHLDTSVRVLDLVRDGVDLALRPGPLEDSAYRARRLGELPGGYYASPALLKRLGPLRTPDDLQRFPTIVVPRSEAPMSWPFTVRGRTVQVAVRPRLSVTSFHLAAQAAAQGLGVVRTPEVFVAEALKRRQLVRVLNDVTLPAYALHAVYTEQALLSPKTRVFLEMVEAWFRRGVQTKRSGRA